LRIVNPPIYELWVSAKRPSSFIFLVHIPIPFGNGKLAQEGSGFVPERNPMKFLAFRPDFADFAAALRCGTIVGSVVGSAVERAANAQPPPEVPLDGNETKSEDYQMDTGTESAQTPIPL
jgi:hypothetical protein